MHHQTFTSDAELARLVGQGLAPFTTTSYAIWTTDNVQTTTDGTLVAIISTNSTTYPTLHAEIFGTQGTDGNGNPGVFVTKIEWSLPNSTTVLSRLTFPSSTYFPFDLQLGFLNPTAMSNGGGVYVTPTQYFQTFYSGGDTLVGGGARDVFYGLAGEDMITGGGGVDLMSGGDHNDTFFYRAGDAVAGEQVTGDGGIDRIVAVGATPAQRAVLQAGAIDISSLVVGTLEQVWTDGHEVIVSSNHLGAGGFNTVVGRNGAIDVFTIRTTGNFGLSTQFTNWEAQDVIGIIGTNGNNEVSSCELTEWFVGLGGNDTFYYDGDETLAVIRDTIDGGTHTTGDRINAVAPDIEDAVPFNGTPLLNFTGATIIGIEELYIASGQVVVRANQLNVFSAHPTLGSFQETARISTIIGHSFHANLLTVQVTPSYLANGNHVLVDFSGLQFQNWSLTEDKVALLIDPKIRLVAGTSQSDHIEVLGNSAGVNIRGGGGHDTIIGSNSADSPLLTFGGGGWTGLDGGAGNDTLYGRGGADWLTGGTGLDTFVGGTGNDVFFVDSQNEVIIELANEGTDTVSAGFTYSLAAKNNVENLILTGTAAINGTGNALGNYISGNAGANVLTGLGGNDRYEVGVGDRIVETSTGGVDTVSSSTISLDLANFAFVERITLLGSANLNAVGGTGSNILAGNAGANVLNGLASSDDLFGGAGRDSFRFTTALNASTNVDRITDFNVADDTIQLDDAVFTRFTAGTAVSTAYFRIGTAAADANDYLIYNRATGALIYDNNGNAAGGATQFATLSTGLALTIADFAII